MHIGMQGERETERERERERVYLFCVTNYWTCARTCLTAQGCVESQMNGEGKLKWKEEHT